MSEIESNNTLQGAQVLYEHLRARTIENKVTSRKSLVNRPPEGVNKEEMSALLAALGGEETPLELKDIAVLKGRKDTYYYDGTIMTRHYAELDSMIQEKDILHTIATVARSDSSLYPRPTQFSKLEDTPFWMTEDELLGAQARFRFEPQYADIEVVEASNGKKGFFSTKYMSRTYAQSLIEWIEVEEDENP